MNAAHLSPPVKVSVDMHDMDGCLKFIQRIKHGNRDSVIAAHHEDLGAGA